jgi:hypothetical protein
MRLGRGWRPGQVGSGGASTPSAGGSAAGRRRNGMKIIPMDYRLTGGVALYLALSHTWGSLPLSPLYLPFISLFYPLYSTLHLTKGDERGAIPV